MNDLDLSYSELTLFQKWSLFYVIKFGRIPFSMSGIFSKMCTQLLLESNLSEWDEQKKTISRRVTSIER